MSMYLLKFSACLAIFWLVYVLVLEQQKNHHFKRFYLLGSLISALIIPLLTITYYIEPTTVIPEQQPLIIPDGNTLVEGQVITEKPIDIATVLWIVYALGVTLMASRFAYNLIQLCSLIRKSKTLNVRSFIYVLLDYYRIPHSFLKYIFLDQKSYNENTIPHEVIIHEETHSRQWHSLDIMLVELLQIALWFHPIIYILKHHIKLNHEFLADQAVLNQGSETKNYQHILLQFSSSTSHHHQLANAINYSSIKKRFTVMKTQTSNTRKWASTLLIIPIIAVLFYSFAEREYIEKDDFDIQQAIQDELKNANDLQLIYVDRPDAIKAYLKKYEVYKKLQDTPPHYINKTEVEQKKMEDLFSELGGMYFRMPKTDKSQVKRPAAPILPYAKITLDGKSYYKKKSELTKEELATLPPPPPPAKTTKGGPNLENTQEVYNPSFFEYIIEMEQLGASFYLDDQKITTKKAKSIALNNKGKRTDMTTQKDKEGNYLVKLSSPQKNHLYARSVDLKILSNNRYSIDGIGATKKTFVSVFNTLHQDITPEVRNKIMNIHVSSSKDISNEEVWFIFNSLQDYGFYRIVTPDQVVNRAKGNTPFAIETSNTAQQKVPTKKEIAAYNSWAKKMKAKFDKMPESEKWEGYPTIVNDESYRYYNSIYDRMTQSQKKNAVNLPEAILLPQPPTRDEGYNNKNKLSVKKQQKPPTTQEVKEYNKWAQRINKKMADAGQKSDKEKWNAYPIVKEKDVKKFKAIYSRMTNSQRANAEAWPSFPPPPPPAPDAPDVPKVIEVKEVPKKMLKSNKGKTLKEVRTTKSEKKQNAPKVIKVKEVKTLPPPPPPKKKLKSTGYKKQNNHQVMMEFLTKEKNNGAILTHVNAQPSKLPYYNTHLTLEEVSDLINVNPNMRLYPYNSPSGKYIVLISNNIENMIPKLNKTNKIEHMDIISSIGAQFYVEDEKVSLNKAKRYIKQNPEATITSTINPPIVTINSL